MESLFDTPQFNERLFFPRGTVTPAPPHALDVRIATDGAELHLRWHHSISNAPTVLLFYGNGETVSDYDAAAPRFAACGGNLAVVDYRGYGSSTGTPTLRGALRDAHAVVPAMQNVRATRVIVMGRSLGSACAAELYARPHDAIDGFIWESGFVDLKGLIRRRGLTPPARLPDADLADFDAGAKLRRGDRPLLVLHGEGDDVIAPSEARDAFELAGAARKELVYIPGRGHNDLSADGKYWDALESFVASTSRAGAP